MRYTFIIVLSATILLFFVACAEESTQQKSEQSDTLVSVNEKATEGDTEKDSLSSDEESVQKEEPTETAEASKYICPNSCPEGHADHSGNCAVCGMELVENPDYSDDSN